MCFVSFWCLLLRLEKYFQFFSWWLSSRTTTHRQVAGDALQCCDATAHWQPMLWPAAVLGTAVPVQACHDLPGAYDASRFAPQLQAIQWPWRDAVPMWHGGFQKRLEAPIAAGSTQKDTRCWIHVLRKKLGAKIEKH